MIEKEQHLQYYFHERRYEFWNLVKKSNTTEMRNHSLRITLRKEYLFQDKLFPIGRISNWENDKSYPDINSIILLSEVLEVSVDNLIKGDIEQMKVEINSEEVKKMKLYSLMMLILFLLSVGALFPLLKFIGFYALIPCFGLWLGAMIFAIKIEQIKKNHNIQSYKEIVAFTEGKRLDEIKRIEENAKRPYQKILSVLLTVFITVFICGFMYIVFR